MNKEHVLNRIKYDIRDRMVKAVFEPLALTHMVALERSNVIGELFPHGEHLWEIDRVHDIWTISCQGPYSWGVRFDVSTRRDCGGNPYNAIDTFTFDDSPFIDTHEHLKMALAFVSSYLVNTNPDGTIANYNSEI